MNVCARVDLLGEVADGVQAGGVVAVAEAVPDEEGKGLWGTRRREGSGGKGQKRDKGGEVEEGVHGCFDLDWRFNCSWRRKGEMGGISVRRGV